MRFSSIVSAVMIVVIAVTIPHRPAAAPQTGPFDLGFGAYPPAGSTFATAWAASIAIYASSANTFGYVRHALNFFILGSRQQVANYIQIPVISEIRRLQDYLKALYACMTWITCSYLALCLTLCVLWEMGCKCCSLKCWTYHKNYCLCCGDSW